MWITMALTFRKKFYFKGKSKTKHPAYKFRRKKKNTLYCFYCPLILIITKLNMKYFILTELTKRVNNLYHKQVKENKHYLADICVAKFIMLNPKLPSLLLAFCVF